MTTVTKHAKRKPQKSVFQRVVAPLLIVLVGLGVMLYPVIASMWNNYQQTKVADAYEELVQEEDPILLNQAVQDAHVYNDEKTDAPILDPWLARISEDNADYQHYLDQLSGQPAMSQVIVPSIDVKLPLYHGTSEKVLQNGLGHLYGTALPVGGEGTHSVITGHTGLTNATLFDDLDKVVVGDDIYISTFGERMKYEVHDIEIVLPHEVDSLGKVPGEDLVTLITCTPYGINTHRILVHAHRVPLDEQEAEVFEEPGFTMQWWMWAVLAVAVLVLLLMAYWVYRQVKKAKAAKEGELDAQY